MNDVNIKLHYMGLLRNTIGCPEEEVVLPNESTVKDLLRALSEKHGEQFDSVMFRSDGRLRPLGKVMVNDKDIRDGDGIETKLQGCQEISLTVGMYPTAGGARDSKRKDNCDGDVNIEENS
jgi:molybdopterin converting factor small subunit